MSTNKKVCLLTGATSGIGEAAAIDLAEKGYVLYLLARNKDKAVVTEQLIRAKTPDAEVHWLYGDLAKLDDVRKIAKEFIATGAPLDLLFNNAGVTFSSRQLTVDGYETMIGVNHLAHFLLSNLLFEKLCEGDNETRVVSTSSGAYTFVKKFNLDNINWEKDFKIFPAYGNSKLANILFIQSFAKKLQEAAPNKVFAVNCFHPGYVGTNLGTESTFGKIISRLGRPFARTSAKGAETGLYLATEPSLSGKNGEYYYDCRAKKLKPYACDTDMADALWQKSLEMVGM